MKSPLVFVSLLSLLATGCSSVSGALGQRTGAIPGVIEPTTTKSLVSRHIKHVVVIIQENRTFENFFAGYPGADAPKYGCGEPRVLNAGAPALPSESSADCPKGDVKIPLHPSTFEVGTDLTHNFETAIIDWDNGRMDGFSKWGLPHKYPAYAYVERSQVAPYWTMARRYVLADAMFPTEFGPSWTGHLTLVAGTDNLNNDDNLALADFATGPSDNCKAVPGSKTTTVNERRVVKHDAGPRPCLTQFNTLASTLDAAGVSWKYYVTKIHHAGIWSPFSAIKYVYEGPDWGNNVIAPQTQVLTDIAQGQLAGVTWVTPSIADSDHPGNRSDKGPSWVTSIVNAIGESRYWDSTAIVVVWDDWGGLYDNVPPPQLDFRGLGIRIPCLIISPYAKRGYVSHTQYEFGSIIKFIEEAFPGVQPLGPTSEGYTDTRAHSLDDSFDFTQPPRAFKRIPSKYPASHFVHEPPSNAPVDTE